MTLEGERPSRWTRMKDAAASSAERQRVSGTFGKVQLSPEGVLTFKRESQPVAGAVARVETAGEIQERVTVSRMFLTGPFAFALKKKKDNRELYLTIEGQDAVWVIDVDPKLGGKAREFAAKVTTVGRKAAIQDKPASAVPVASSSADESDVTVQLMRLADLRDRGALSDREFETQKAKLLRQ